MWGRNNESQLYWNKLIVFQIIAIGLNPFHPDFIKWTFPSLNKDMSFVANRNASQNILTERQTV